VGETVEILTDNALTFTVHKNVLLQSPFFANALKPEWVSARDGKPIDLTDIESDIFGAYVQWLYTHHIDTTFDTTKWAKEYVLGEKLMDMEYQDQVLEVMVRECEAAQKFPAASQINIIYDGTTESSPARKLLIDFFCWNGGSQWLNNRDYANTAPADFVNELLRALMSLKSWAEGERPWVGDISTYFVGSRKKAE